MRVVKSRPRARVRARSPTRAPCAARRRSSIPPPCGCAACATRTSPRARARDAPIPERLDAPREEPPLTRPPPTAPRPHQHPERMYIQVRLFGASAGCVLCARALLSARPGHAGEFLRHLHLPLRGLLIHAAPSPPPEGDKHGRFVRLRARGVRVVSARPHSRAAGSRAQLRATCTIPPRGALTITAPRHPPQASRMTLPIACAPAQSRRARNHLSSARPLSLARLVPDARPYSLHAVGGRRTPSSPQNDRCTWLVKMQGRALLSAALRGSKRLQKRCLGAA